MTLKEVIKQLGIKLIGWVKSNCVNNLLSDRTDLPLSAAQGKALDGKITALNSNIDKKLQLRTSGKKNVTVNANNYTGVNSDIEYKTGDRCLVRNTSDSPLVVSHFVNTSGKWCAIVYNAGTSRLDSSVLFEILNS